MLRDLTRVATTTSLRLRRHAARLWPGGSGAAGRSSLVEWGEVPEGGPPTDDLPEVRPLREAFDEAQSRIGAARDLDPEESWRAISHALGIFAVAAQRSLRDALDNADDDRRQALLDAMLEVASLTGTHRTPGPYLLPLILRSYDRFADFCRDHDVDPSHLHRLLENRSSLSLGRLRKILEDLPERTPPRELRFVPADPAKLGILERPRHGSTEEAFHRSSSLTLEELCEREYRALVGGEPSPLPPGSFDRSYVLRVLRRATPGSFRFFSLLAFPRHLVVPLPAAMPEVIRDEREESIGFGSDW